MTRFAHLSDAHIGHRQYGLKKRRDDMYMSFHQTLLDGIDEGIDFAVFGGDLFHNKNVNARTLNDAETALTSLQDAGIPIAGVQGNHDANLYREDLNWLEYLHQRERLVLLEADFHGDGPLFEPHDFENPGTSSGFVEFDDVRVFGLQYSGQRTSDRLAEVADGIRAVNTEYGPADVTILVGHFGIEGHIPGVSGGISYGTIQPLEDLVDYLALGHLHKQYSHEGWVYNPGSLEAHDAREAEWDLGYYTVDVEDEDLAVDHHRSKRRPFYRFEFGVDAYESPEALMDGFRETVGDEGDGLRDVRNRDHHLRHGNPRDPVIGVRLNGLLQFPRSQLDVDAIEDNVEDQMDAMYVNLSDATESRETAAILQEIEEGEDAVRDEDGQLDRAKLEGAVFRKLAGQNSQYAEHDVEVAEALSGIKAEVLADESPEAVAESIKHRRREIFSDGQGDDQ